MFGIENSKDRLLQLKNNFELLKQDELNISLAEQTCSDAWHLIDWVYEEKKQSDITLTKEQFRKTVYEQCQEMKIHHDLVNSFKHKNLSRQKVKIIETRVHGGAISSGFSKGFDVSRLEVHFEDKSKIDVDDLVEIAINYWNKVILE
ncbi:hypothetical protein E1176_01850 [Fulvivirga sp. RKSG066]|uniref:hypothetical protein n=1 Tax=Fulvivirga aurantia TaxID=2529383 RepID=UPI0012BC0216|nr:hypothetical protein [Fulvivirga aurantia]MTI19756.1 hypothetical protein [Fulvivirga aurantia]